jgi:hypothetical protein
MPAPSNDYICRIKTFSTFLGRSRYTNQLASPLDFLTPLPPKQDPPAHRLVPTIATRACLQDQRCTVASAEIKRLLEMATRWVWGPGAQTRASHKLNRFGLQNVTPSRANGDMRMTRPATAVMANSDARYSGENLLLLW